MTTTGGEKKKKKEKVKKVTPTESKTQTNESVASEGTKKKEKAKAKALQVGRVESAAKVVITKKGSIKELVKLADSAYVSAGGKTNEKESRWAVNVAVQALTGAGIIKVEEGVVKSV